MTTQELQDIGEATLASAERQAQVKEAAGKLLATLPAPQIGNVLLKEVATPDLESYGVVAARAWIGGGLRVIVSLDPTPHGILLHASISHKHRDPTWAEIKAMRAALFPAEADCMMLLPRQSNYINIQEHTFHVWLTPERWRVS
jgi:hypothetical protein